MSWAGSPLIFFNKCFLIERVANFAELKGRLHAAAEYMRAKPQAGLFYICDDYLSDEVRPQLKAAIGDAGLAPTVETVGMVGDFLSFERPVQCPGLRFERVTDEEALRSFADINSHAQGLPLEMLRGGLDRSTLWKERAFCYIGYHDGDAVSTASVFESEGHLYVTFVATMPGAQRRGFGAATMRRALEVAHDATGLHRTSLHATRAGLPVYERMGYRSVTRIAGYTLASAADAATLPTPKTISIAR
jgi:GNAT superfamily N-acetyltransferase